VFTPGSLGESGLPKPDRTNLNGSAARVKHMLSRAPAVASDDAAGPIVFVQADEAIMRFGVQISAQAGLQTSPVRAVIPPC
jgi:hypothetical protein